MSHDGNVNAEVPSGRIGRLKASTLTRTPGDTEKSRRGGARPGPKPNPDTRMVTTAFVITQRHAAWLEAQTINTGESKSELVRRALDIFIQMSR